MTAAVRHQVAERDRAADWGERYAHTEEQNQILRGELDGAVERCARLADALTELKAQHSGVEEELGEAKIKLGRAEELEAKYQRALQVLSRVQVSADAHQRALFNAVQRSGAEIRLHMLAIKNNMGDNTVIVLYIQKQPRKIMVGQMPEHPGRHWRAKRQLPPGFDIRYPLEYKISRWVGISKSN